MKIKSCLILSMMLYSTLSISAQKDDVSRTIYTDTCDIYFNYTELKDFQQSDIKCDSCWYYYFALNSIVKNQGGRGGKVLNGAYLEKYKNGSLKVRGYFRGGLKHGEWRSWNLDGKLQSIETYSEGELHGTQVYFEREGKIERKFRKGREWQSKKEEKPKKKRKLKTENKENPVKAEKQEEKDEKQKNKGEKTTSSPSS